MSLKRIGLQTIIYGENFPRGIEAALEEIKKLGFNGVEFFQTPSKLGEPASFEPMMKHHGLVLLGLTGGSIEDRRAFCKQTGLQPKFVYIQDLEKETLDKALACKWHVAVHPIQYSKLDSYASAVQKLKEIQSLHPEIAPDRISILPDSGHLYLGNENLADILEKDRDKIRYVHIKDWSPQYGTSMFSYARGFCELGRGEVMSKRLHEILLKWHSSNPENWIIVEQDSTQKLPHRSCRISMDWLYGSSAAASAEPLHDPEAVHYRTQQAAAVLKEKATNAYVAEMIDTLSRANLDCVRDVDQHYRTILQGFSKLADLKYASIWEISPREQTNILRSAWQPRSASKLEKPVRKLRLDQALCGLAIAKQETICFEDVTAPREDGRKFVDQDLIERVGVRSMVSIPIPNHWNPHQPELIINLFPKTLAEIVSERSFTPRFQAALDLFKSFLSITIERAWEQERAEIRDELNWIAAKSETVSDLLNNAVEPIKKHLRCGEVKIYLLNEPGTHMRQVAPSMMDPPLFEKDPSNIIGKVWADRTGYNSGTNPDEKMEPESKLLVAPIYRQGRPLREVMGVIHCKDKKGANDFKDLNNFTVTDDLIMDAAQLALVPQLERMGAAERRTRTMARVNHELKNPLTIVRGATSAAIEEMTKNAWKFKMDHLGTMRSYLMLMEHVVAKVAFLKQDVALKLKHSRILLFKDVIQPAIDHLEVYFKRYRLSRKGIIRREETDVSETMLDGEMEAINIRKLPPLFVDQIRFQQVVFNILSNAIKYAKPDANSFRVAIIAARAKEQPGTHLIFRDWGTGIPRGMEEAIFLEGVRGPDALESDVTGDGLGLFLVREILSAHGATIKVTKSKEPTEFTIFLPAALADLGHTMRSIHEQKHMKELERK